MFKKPEITLQTTTLWDYPSQHYGVRMQGDKAYKGATPSYVIWNLLKRYTKPNAVVLDPMCGSGTTLDVALDLGRQGLGFDLEPFRKDIRQADARHLPVVEGTVDFVFIDPPYSTHLKYSGRPECIGELDAEGGGYFEAMEQVIAEIARVLKPGGHMALYVTDSHRAERPFQAIGFELFARLRQHFETVDIVSVTRHNKTLKNDHWQRSAAIGNYFLRGFNYLFIMKKPGGPAPAKTAAPAAASDSAPAKARTKPPRVPPLAPPAKQLPRGKQLKKKKHRI